LLIFGNILFIVDLCC